MSDDEMLLIKKESKKYDEVVSKAIMRERLFQIKNEGYSSVNPRSEALMRIFFGYLSKIESSPSFEEIIPSLIKDSEQKIIYILENRIKTIEEIIKLLR